MISPLLEEYCSFWNEDSIESLLDLLDIHVVYQGITRKIEGKLQVSGMYRKSFESGTAGKYQAMKLSETQVGLFEESQLK
ncbi:MAG: hypothetical protein ACR2PX_26405 [Endozoicomonas sp.]|uniref:hypothetical protein n=1 Tax=Endozoicomonas sp. TaxID=1892382 RepID=UPI003D9BCD6A